MTENFDDDAALGIARRINDSGMDYTSFHMGMYLGGVIALINAGATQLDLRVHNDALPFIDLFTASRHMSVTRYDIDLEDHTGVKIAPTIELDV